MYLHIIVWGVILPSFVFVIGSVVPLLYSITFGGAM